MKKIFMDFSFLIYEVKERIAFLTLNRPEKRNALNGQMVKELREAFHRAAADAQVRVVVLRGNGPAFSAGADLEYLQQLQGFSLEQNQEDSRSLMSLFELIYYLEKPVIAQVEGSALAGGCGLASICDFCYSIPEASFGYTEVKIGFIPALVGVFLVRKIGEGRARELLLTGKLITASQAMNYGLITGVVEKEALGDQVLTLAGELAALCSGNSLKETKRWIGEIFNHSFTTAMEMAADLNARVRGSQDCQLGIQAFLDKKKPIW
ncbi:MAG: enoyl-CoA hydratase/isomerase family protein [Chitinophagaceae bacterium]